MLYRIDYYFQRKAYRESSSNSFPSLSMDSWNTNSNKNNQSMSNRLLAQVNLLFLLRFILQWPKFTMTLSFRDTCEAQLSRLTIKSSSTISIVLLLLPYLPILNGGYYSPWSIISAYRTPISSRFLTTVLPTVPSRLDHCFDGLGCRPSHLPRQIIVIVVIVVVIVKVLQGREIGLR